MTTALQDRVRSIARTERTKAGVRDDEIRELPPDDGKARPHVSCNVAKARQWWRIAWRGHEWLVLFTDALTAIEVGAWAYRMGYDGATLESVDGWPQGYGKP